MLHMLPDKRDEHPRDQLRHAYKNCCWWPLANRRKTDNWRDTKWKQKWHQNNRWQDLKLFWSCTVAIQSENNSDTTAMRSKLWDDLEATLKWHWSDTMRKQKRCNRQNDAKMESTPYENSCGIKPKEQLQGGYIEAKQSITTIYLKQKTISKFSRVELHPLTQFRV